MDMGVIKNNYPWSITWLEGEITLCTTCCLEREDWLGRKEEGVSALYNVSGIVCCKFLALFCFFVKAELEL